MKLISLKNLQLILNCIVLLFFFACSRDNDVQPDVQNITALSARLEFNQLIAEQEEIIKNGTLEATLAADPQYADKLYARVTAIQRQLGLYDNEKPSSNNARVPALTPGPSPTSFDRVKDSRVRERLNNLSPGIKEVLYYYVDYLVDSSPLTIYGSKYYYMGVVYNQYQRELKLENEAFSAAVKEKELSYVLSNLVKYIENIIKINSRFSPLLNSLIFKSDYSDDIRTYDKRLDLLLNEGKISCKFDGGISAIDFGVIDFRFLNQHGLVELSTNVSNTTTVASGKIFYLENLDINTLKNIESALLVGRKYYYSLSVRSSLENKANSDENTSNVVLRHFSDLLGQPVIHTGNNGPAGQSFWLSVEADYMPF